MNKYALKFICLSKVARGDGKLTESSSDSRCGQVDDFKIQLTDIATTWWQSKENNLPLTNLVGCFLNELPCNVLFESG